jgi:hypothetical protein
MVIKHMEYIKNVGSKVGAFISKAAPIIGTVGNAISYFPGKVGNLAKLITITAE